MAGSLQTISGSGKREIRKTERREAIVEIARRSFMQLGYGRTSMSAIAEEMGGSKGTLWSYFKSKEALFAAVLDTATAEFHKVLTGTLDRNADIASVLTVFCEAFIERITAADAVALQRLIVGEVARFPEIGRIFYDRAPGQSRLIMTTYLASEMIEGRLSVDVPEQASGMLLALCTGGYHQRVVWGVEEPSSRAAKNEAIGIVDQFLRCYGVE